MCNTDHTSKKGSFSYENTAAPPKGNPHEIILFVRTWLGFNAPLGAEDGTFLEVNY